MTQVATRPQSLQQPHPSLSYAGVEAAARVLAEHLPPTPVWRYPVLDERVGVRVHVKHENVQPTGAFKVRGSLALLAGFDAEARSAGVVTVSTGNHAQAMAYAGARFGVPVTVVVPVTAPAGKLAAVRALGGQVVVVGADMGEAAGYAVRLAEREGRRFVSPADEPAIVHGHATLYRELLLAHPDLQAIYVPVGSGSGAAGACLVRDALAPSCRIIAVQSAQAPAAFASWSTGRLMTARCTTSASGLATASGFALPQSVLAEGLADFRLVDDAEIDAARRILARDAHTLAEGAGAAALAGLLADEARPERCAVVVSGGNADDRELATLT